jgi:hypothetical protein
MENQITRIQATTMELHHLTTCSELDLARFERNLSIQDCVISREPSIYSMAVHSEAEILKTIFRLTQRFLMVNFPDSPIDLISSQFAQDIIALRRDWNINDIIMFFKFIRTRQDLPELKTYGSKITAIKLIEFSHVYENERIDVKEEFLTNQKNARLKEQENNLAVNKLFSTEIFKSFGAELADKQEKDKEQERKDKIERANRTNKYHKENEFCLEWLRVNKVEDKLASVWYHNFLIRKQN